jgi:hypothetical protein
MLLLLSLMLLVSLLHIAGFSTDSGGPADVNIYDVPIVTMLLLLSLILMVSLILLMSLL